MTVRARLVGRRRTALATVWQSSLPPVAGGLAFPRPGSTKTSYSSHSALDWTPFIGPRQ
jgi:hypothetical protein